MITFPHDPGRRSQQPRAAAAGGGTQRARGRWGASAAFALAALATAYPPAITLGEEGISGAFRYFASDAFYYLAVARRSAGAAFYTFDGRFPTNGFHPLWQYYLTLAFEQLRLLPAGQVLFAFWSGVVFSALGTGLFAAALQRATGSVALALLASVPGFYYALLPVLDPHSFAQWSFVNGMESSLSVLGFGLLCHLLVNRRLLSGAPGIARVLALSALLTLLVLARLDDIFLFVPFGVLFLVGPGAPRERLARAAALGVVPLLCLGAYLAFNLSYAGTLVPVSGAAKNEGLVWGGLRNSYAVFTTFLPFVDPLARGNAVWGSEAWRVLQMLVPAGAAAAWIACSWRGLAAPAADERGEQRLVLTLLCAYVVLKASYGFAFVRLWHQGQWYYPASIMTFDWIVAAALGAAIARRRAPGPVPALALVAAGLFVLLHANAFVDVKRRGGFGAGNHRFWERREAIGRELERVCPGCGLVEFDDGILSYSLPMPVMSGLGLALDKTAFDAWRRGALFEVAYERGFRLLASLNYPMPPAAYGAPERLRQALAGNVQLRGQTLDRWDFETVHVDAESGVAFVAFRPRSGRWP